MHGSLFWSMQVQHAGPSKHTSATVLDCTTNLAFVFQNQRSFRKSVRGGRASSILHLPLGVPRQQRENPSTGHFIHLGPLQQSRRQAIYHGNQYRRYGRLKPSG